MSDETCVGYNSGRVRIRLPLLLAALAVSAGLYGQNTGITTLGVRVEPQARVEPAVIPLVLTVGPDGSARVTVQVRAWARPAAGRPVRLNVETAAGGTLPLTGLRWTAERVDGAGGGRQAQCAGGAYGDPLVTSWNRGGTLTCAYTFYLEGAAPGTFSGALNLRLDVW